MAGININESTLEYFEEGDGEPLVLVHGSASDYRTWQNQFYHFSNHFRTIKYSRRFHWPNQQIPGGAEYTMPEQLDDLEALLRTLDAEPAHLMGHSYGAFLCLLLAIREPSLARSLILIEPPIFTLFVSNIPKPTELLKLFLSRPRTAYSIIKLGAKGFVPAQKAFERGAPEEGIRLFGNAVFGPGGFDKLPEERKDQVYDNMSNAKAELLGPGFLSLDANQLRRIKIPTLLTNGENSINLFHHLNDRLEELIPNTERHSIPGSSHNMHESNPKIFNDIALSFLKTVATEF